MGKKLKATCLIIVAAAFAMMVISLIVDKTSSAAANQQLREYMSSNMWMIVLPNVISLIFALIYILKDGTKKAAFYYKGFLFFCLISQIVFILSVFVGSYSVLASGKMQPLLIVFLLAWIIEYSMLLLLAFARDLGKKNSLILALFAVIMNICIIVLFFTLGFSLSILLRNASKILIIVLLYLLVVVKYKDKDARGTK
ncbi:MAG: hypothetical protein K6G83_11100 [Lachnospiraceae bacterium]|nr:hypothetical protein [Lachnospiraceae bacterium]